MNPVVQLFLASDRRLRPSWRFGVSLAVIVFAAVLSGVPAHLVPRGHGYGGEFLFRTAFLLSLLSGFAALLYLLDRERGYILGAMGLRLDRAARRDSLVGTALGAGMVAGSVAAMALAGRVEFHWIGGPRVLLAILAVVYITAVAAMAEEVAFRGYPFQRLVEGIGAVGGIVVLSVLFGAIHLGNPHASIWGLLNTIGIGAVLAVAYLRTRSLWMPWGIHFGWNLTLGMGFGLPVSGINEFAVAVQGTAEGPAWLTGGGYGIEASLTGSVVILLAFFVLLRMTPSPPAPPPQLAKAPE
ncbi:MAG TPA: type II CAAX endopeptidase family protein [Terriglobales bacterium]|nr:type II CAAX endopeptidase family protein [Terriglobales bacterium]